MNDLFERLRTRVLAAHRQLDHSPAVRRIVAPSVTLDDLTWLLHIQCAFYLGLEARLQQHGLAQHSFAPLYQPRATLLAADLQRLAHRPPPAAAIDDFPDSPQGLLGVIYAVEGSALGGRLIDRRLHERLGSALAGQVAFFSHYAHNVDAHWKAVQDALRSALLDTHDVEQAALGAEAVFHTLHRFATRDLPAPAPPDKPASTEIPR